MEKQFHSLYFIGIKGVGMSALAIVAQGMGYTVAGSDVAESFITAEPLAEAMITVHDGFSADHITDGIDLVIAGAAYGESNPEYQAATDRQLPIWTYSELLGYLGNSKKLIAVAGTHGKTTTTSILSYLLYAGGYEPSYVIGTGHVSGLPSHGFAGDGEFFVAEADDYKRAPNDPRPKFLDLAPYAAIITSIEHDHPDMYPSLRDCVEAFYQFILRVRPDGFLVVNGDDQNIEKLRLRVADRRFVSYGFGEAVNYRIAQYGHQFTLTADSQVYGPFQLNLQGKHNVMNATAAIVVAIESGVPVATLIEHLPAVVGVERRYQVMGERNGSVIIDDYAHHPTAVALTLETAKQQYPYRSLWCLFQPHTFSRTKALLAEFGGAFQAADVVIITDIFGSAREQGGDITARDLVAEIGKQHRNVLYVPYEKLAQFVERNLPAGIVAITMGAGDIYKIGQQYLGQAQPSLENDPYETLKQEIPNLVANEPLSKHCTIRVGGPAAAFVIVRSVDELVQAVTAARHYDVPFHVVGGGSNTLFSDSGFSGLVIKNMANQLTIAGAAEQIQEESWQSPQAGEVRHEAADPTKYITFTDLDYEERPGDTLVVAESGVNLTAFIIKTLDSGFTGMQWYGGIPGVVGGAVFNNIHGGTHFIGERLVRVKVLLEDGEITTFEKNELKLGYDTSRFHGTKDIILSAEFLLTKSNSLEVERAEKAFREWVRRKSQMQPKLGSMGSTFQNIAQADRERIGAPTTAAGWLIDQCGLKGHRIGNAQFAPEHANFIVNLGGATAADVHALMELAQTSVKQKFGVDIRPEVFMIGVF